MISVLISHVTGILKIWCSDETCSDLFTFAHSLVCTMPYKTLAHLPGPFLHFANQGADRVDIRCLQPEGYCCLKSWLLEACRPLSGEIQCTRGHYWFHMFNVWKFQVTRVEKKRLPWHLFLSVHFCWSSPTCVYTKQILLMSRTYQ